MSSLKKKVANERETETETNMKVDSKACEQEMVTNQEMNSSQDNKNFIPIKVEYLPPTEKARYPISATNPVKCSFIGGSRTESMKSYNTSKVQEKPTAHMKMDTFDNLLHNPRRRRCYLCHQHNHISSDCLQVTV